MTSFSRLNLRATDPLISRFVKPLLACVSLLVSASFAQGAQPLSNTTPPTQTAAASQDKPVPTFAPPTREELAVAYRRIDTLVQKQLASEAPDAAALARVNRDFDAATLKFFSGQFATVLKDLALASGSLIPGTNSPDADAWLALRSLGMVFELQGAEPQIVLRSIFPLDRAVKTSLLFSIGTGIGSDFSTHPLHIEPGSSFELRIPLKQFIHPHADRALSIQYTVAQAAQQDHWESRPFILPSPEHQLMIDDLETQFAKVPDVAPTALSRSIVRARLNLLKESRTPINSAHFMGFSSRVLAEINGDLKLLRYGKSPFANRDGVSYRPIILEGTAIPNYIYAPPTAFGRGPVPLIIALHGAGGDEAMFIVTYGNGEAKRQAEANGCIIASPSTNALLTSPAALDALIEQMAADYPIDRARVFVIGHSMGAAAASGLARTRATSLAGAVCLAGGRMPTKPLGAGDSLAPMLAIYATLDPLTGSIDVNRINEAAKTNALPIEAREMKDWGHTLMVGAALPQAFEWIMDQKPIAQKQPTAK